MIDQGFYRIPDSFGNCLIYPDPILIDTKDDGFGNICDPDFDQSCAVNFFDFSIFTSAFGTNSPLVDLDSSGAVNFPNSSILVPFIVQPPGPSGVPTHCDD